MKAIKEYIKYPRGLPSFGGGGEFGPCRPPLQALRPNPEIRSQVPGPGSPQSGLLLRNLN